MKKTALITGASKGIGKAIALKLAKEDYNIVVNYVSNAALAEDVVNEITRLGGHATAVQGDVSQASEVKNMFAEAHRQFGAVDVVVNNAGVMKLNLVKDFDEAAFQTLFDVNVKGTFNTLKECCTQLSDGGSIVNLSTSAIGLAIPSYAIYNATKAAVEALTYTFTRELRGRNIRVNCVAPGPTATDLFLNGKTDEQIERFRKTPPLERLGTPEDIANVVHFLASDAGSWINGQVLKANGGII